MQVPVEHKGDALWYRVPDVAVTSIEHPFIIQDITNAIDYLGGSALLEKMVGPEGEGVESQLRLHPNDRMSSCLSSKAVRTNDLLLQITVPKRIGRKRKRAFNELHNVLEYAVEARDSEYGPSGHSKNAGHLLRSIKDNIDKYRIEPVGGIGHTHRFRDMPDFVYSTTNSKFMQKMRDHILPFNYDKAMGFSFDMRRGPTPNIDLIPPPSFTHLSLPFNYLYRQNPLIKQTVSASGDIVTINPSVGRKVMTQRVAYDVTTVPTAPIKDLPPVATLEKEMRSLIGQLEDCLNERPIWTRRALKNRLPSFEWKNMGRYIYQYVGYMFRSGPWRETIIKYGIDPRSDSRFRIYQTMMFQFESRALITKISKGSGRGEMKKRGKKYNGDGRSHIFDGITVELDGKVWQACDVTDNLVQSILATTDLRPECHLRADGWYHNGTWAKARLIAKLKMLHIIAGKGTPKDEDYTKIVGLPDIMHQDNRHLSLLGKEATSQELEWATILRTMAGSPERVAHIQQTESLNGDGDGYETGRQGNHDNMEMVGPRGRSSAQEFEAFYRELGAIVAEAETEDEADEGDPISSAEEEHDPEDVEQNSDEEDDEED